MQLLVLDIYCIQGVHWKIHSNVKLMNLLTLEVRVIRRSQLPTRMQVRLD